MCYILIIYDILFLHYGLNGEIFWKFIYSLDDDKKILNSFLFMVDTHWLIHPFVGLRDFLWMFVTELGLRLTPGQVEREGSFLSFVFNTMSHNL